MKDLPLDENAIFEVAKEIRDPAVRDKYLAQVCGDERLLGRVEGRLIGMRPRWRFSLRALLTLLLFVGCGLGASGLVLHQMQRAIQAEAEARGMADEAWRAESEADALMERARQLSIEAAADSDVAPSRYR